jgi:hypothetical protein
MLNIVSFVDRDMVMRYFGGGIGHLKNTPPQQVPGFDPIDPSSEEMAVDEDDGDDDPCNSTNGQQSSRDFVTNSAELEVNEDDDVDKDDDDTDNDNDNDDEDDEDEDSDDGNEGGDQTDEDEDEEREDDYGYAST